MKHILKYMMLPLGIILLFSACNKEDSVVASDEPTTDEITSKQTIQLNVVADMALPSEIPSSEARLSRIELDINDAKFRPSVIFNKSSLKAKLYLRKKGSKNPNDIFSVTIDYGEWTSTTFSNRNVILKRTREFGSLLIKDVPVGKKAPQIGEQWEAAVILGDGDNEDSKVKSKIDLNDSENAPFKEDGVWIVKPRTLAYSTADKAQYKESLDNSVDDAIEADMEDDDLGHGWSGSGTTPSPSPSTPRWEHSKHMLDIPYTADWTDVSIGADRVINVKLHAKPAGALFHYSLQVFDTNGTTPLVSDLPPGTGAPSHGLGTSRVNVDALETSIGTWGGALYYNQDGNTVHWKHGKKIAWGNSPNEIPYMDEVGGASAHRLYVGEVKAWVQLLYFLMPPFENGTITGAQTNKLPTFSMRAKERISTSEGPYIIGEALYKLRKGSSGAWEDEYVSQLSRLTKGGIHHVHLQAKKNY